jgi:hypothetical protein
MADFVVDNSGDDRSRGVDLVDGDRPPVRLIVRGELPSSIDHDGRVWVPTDEVDEERGALPIAVYRPADRPVAGTGDGRFPAAGDPGTTGA